MEVKVSQLLPNPHRKLERYPIDEEKVKNLVESIKDTSFWDNILARPSSENGVYEIAYGHHRMEALKRVGIKKINIPIRELSNEKMLQIMANENMQEWETNPKVIIQTIKRVRNHLQGEVSKCRTLKEFLSKALEFKGLIKNEQEFQTLRSCGIGTKTIKSFLGGAWENKDWLIAETLRTIKAIEDKELSQKAVEEFETTKPVGVFREVAKEQKIPLKDQKKIAKDIVQEKIPQDKIKEVVREHITTQKPVSNILQNLRKEQVTEKDRKLDRILNKPPLPDIDQFVSEQSGLMAGLESNLTKLTNSIVHVRSSHIRDQFYINFNKLQKRMDNFPVPNRKIKSPIN